MEEKRITPLKAIRLKCLECCCGSHKEVKQCQAVSCQLHPFRFGKNPRRLGIGGRGVVSEGKPTHESNLLESVKTEG